MPGGVLEDFIIGNCCFCCSTCQIVNELKYEAETRSKRNRPAPEDERM
jgi:hypothetical protein